MNQEEYDRAADLQDVFAFGGVLEVSAALESGKVSINQELLLGETPLGVAVRFSNLPVVRFLLESGADVNGCYPNKRAEPPAKVAYDNGNRAVFDILSQAGADLSLPGWMNISVLDRMRDQGVGPSNLLRQ